MGEVFIEGLGVIEIEGDTPTDEEQQAIMEAIGDPTDEGDPTITAAPPPIPPVQVPPGIGLTPSAPEPREGPFGVMPLEARAGVRETVEKQPGLVQFVTEITPSTLGTLTGMALGAPAGPAGVAGGGAVGGLFGELIAQETGLAPTSRLNALLSGGGPLLGEGLGRGARLLRRGVGAGLTRGFPASRVARARNVMGRSVDEFDSLGTAIINKQRGLAAKPSSELYEMMAKRKILIKPEQVKGTRAAIEASIKELDKLSAFPEVKQSIQVLTNLKDTLLNNPQGILLEDLVDTRSLVGAVFAKAQAAGGKKLRTSGKLFSQLSDDLDQIAKSPFAKGRNARLAKQAVGRAKLEFAVRDLENAIAKFTVRDKNIQGGIRINVKGLQSWLDDITNPKRIEKFDKNFTTALADELPDIKARVDALAEIATTASPGGPGSIVLRGQSAKIGRGLVGGALGFLGTGGSAVGAAIGGLAFAQLPEMLVAVLTTRGGAAFLERAARLGKGEISRRAWIAATQVAMRSLGERGTRRQDASFGETAGLAELSREAPAAKDEETEKPKKRTNPRTNPRKRQPTRGQLRKPNTETTNGSTPAGDVTVPEQRTRKRLPKDFK